MNKKSILLTIATFGLFLGAAAPAHAMDFGSCLNPQWPVSQVNVGTAHGVIGVGTFAGTDTIYASGGNVLQCLCTGNGKGYQTNWLKASDLSESDINVYKKEGWMYVATGSNWGLQDTPYLAKNSEYTCNGEEALCTPTPTPTEGPTATPTTTPGATNTPTPQVQSAVFSLAKTGNAGLIAAFLLSGITSFIIGMVLKRFSK